MIRHASIYDPSTDDDGLRVLVMRYWPRGVKRERVGVWLKDAAPSVELIRDYRHAGLAWPEFEQRYRAEMAARPQVFERLRDLEAEHGTLTLLCTERTGECHRLILREMLGEAAAAR